jgi:P-type Ca2+ transporter type 2C
MSLCRPLEVTTDLSEQTETDSSHQRNSMSLSPSTNSGSFLAVQTPSSPNPSLDGQTLHSRACSSAGSFRSVSIGRFRSNSTRTFVGQSDLELEPAEEALRPDKGSEGDFEVSSNPFAFSPGQLNKLLNPKSLSAFIALGGLSGLEKGLRTSLAAGLSIDEETLNGTVSFSDATQELKKSSSASKVFEDVPINSDEPSATANSKGKFGDRIRVFRDNRLPEKKADSIWKLIWKTYNDKILILLTIAAVVSLSLGLYETFSGGSSADWVEGVAICVAIIIVVVVGAANDYQKERQFIKLNKRKDDRVVKAIRSGKSVEISVYDVTVGDVLHLEPGDAVPADGIFISGHSVKCDESSATGESDQMKKTSGIEVQQRLLNGTATKKLDPFIISGSKVLEGVGNYLVTSVGQNSSYGKILMSLQTESEDTPLQVKLGKLANWIGGLGSGVAALLFFILLFRFLANLSSNTATPAVKGQQFLNILIVAITVIVVAVPEGLPLAVTLALAFATTRMLKENNLVRALRACETMGNATTICSDKTGTLTQNKMTVVAGTLGIDERMTLAADSTLAGDNESSTFIKAFKMTSVETRELLLKSIALNSTAFEGEDKGVPTFIGSKTETALLSLAKDFLGLESLATERSNAEIVQLIPFDSGRKCMGAVFKTDGRYRLLVKGAAEIMLAQATQSISAIYDEDLDISPMTPEGKEELSATIDEYAQHSLRTIGLLYKDFEQWPPAEGRSLEEDKSMANFDSIFHSMTWIGVVGIHDPLREGVIEAVAQCQKSGVVVRMVTGDNLTTAHAIATECGIMNYPEAQVMEGPKFRQLSDTQMDEVLPNLRVLARSSPEDKRILVQRLKHLGETVAVTGDGTNDGPALKMADVGFSMGIAGTEVAKEASSIILLDDNFSSTITALMWGRAVNDAVKKFLQFQITVNITAVILTFVSAVSNSSNHSVLTAVQLLWVNLIMDTLAALALATDAPTEKILNRPPEKKAAPLITMNMWKMISGQAVYQLIVTFILYFAGRKIFSYGPSQQKELDTMVFNTFVWMQIFNELNNRRLDNRFNIFEGILKNYWFLGINVIMVAGQIMIVFVGGTAFGITRIDGVQWAVCILCALPCLLWAVLLRLIPDAYFAIVFEAVTGAVAFVWRPVRQGLHFVFHPVAQAWRGMSRAVKRAVSKMTVMKNTAQEEAPVDEEAAPATRSAKKVVDERAAPSTPIMGKVVDEEGVRPLASPPPIIFTTAPPS